jgi:HxlR-like helix-turn-helix
MAGLAGADALAAGQDQLRRRQVVADQAKPPAQPAEPAAQCQPGYAGVGHDPRWRAQPERLGGGVEVTPQGARLHPCAAAPAVHPDLAHAREVDAHRAVTLLAQRLRALERAQVIERVTAPTGPGARYYLTSAGHELADVVLQMGTWGARWLDLAPADYDAAVVLWAWAKFVDAGPPTGWWCGSTSATTPTSATGCCCSGRSRRFASRTPVSMRTSS